MATWTSTRLKIAKRGSEGVEIPDLHLYEWQKVWSIRRFKNAERSPGCAAPLLFLSPANPGWPRLSLIIRILLAAKEDSRSSLSGMLIWPGSAGVRGPGRGGTGRGSREGGALGPRPGPTPHRKLFPPSARRLVASPPHPPQFAAEFRIPVWYGGVKLNCNGKSSFLCAGRRSRGALRTSPGPL